MSSDRLSLPQHIFASIAMSSDRKDRLLSQLLKKAVASSARKPERKSTREILSEFEKKSEALPQRLRNRYARKPTIPVQKVDVEPDIDF